MDKSLLSSIREDYRAWTASAVDESQFHLFLRVMARPGTYAVSAYRLGHWLLGKPIVIRFFLDPVYWLWERRMRTKWGISIDRRAVIGAGFQIEHFGGVFIGREAVIGRNFYVFHDVTLGYVHTGPKRGQPIVGDDVTVFEGAKLVGKVRIGSGSTIGPNVVVYRDLPEFSVVQVALPQMLRMPPRCQESVPEH